MNTPNHIYHIFPLGALRKEGGGYRNLATLAEWIPHLQSLRIDSVLLGPVFQSETHGYDVTDLRRVDPRLGSWEDLQHLVQAFHAAGIGVILDAVWNHTSRMHYAYRDLLALGPRSKYANWYRNVRWGVRNLCGDPFTVDAWAGFQDLPELNLLEPEVQNEIIDIASLWIRELRIDGVRLDAADVMDRGFLRRLSDACHAQKENFWMVGEVVNGDYRLWIQDAGLDSVTNYEGYKSLWSSFNDANFFEIAYSVNRLSGDDSGLCRGDKLLLFNENHDVARLASVLKKPEHLYPLHLLHYTLPGIPSLYYGEEWGFQGVKGKTDDWDLRPAMPTIPPTKIPQPDLLHNLQRLAEFHMDNVALREGGYFPIFVSAEQIAFVRTYGKESLLVVVNASDKAVNLNLDLTKVNLVTSKGGLTDILNRDSPGVPLEKGHLKVTVPAYWGRVFSLC
jgi:cyclomaltodextrinase / maltogenic alpha-amylase / neopullulanase